MKESRLVSLQIKCNMCQSAQDTTFKDLQKQFTDVGGTTLEQAAAVIVGAPVGTHICSDCASAIRDTVRGKHRLPGG